LRIAALFVADAADSPVISSGAYLLLVTLPDILLVARPGRSAVPLRPGRFLYAGSARGPGGLRARLTRHQRNTKTLYWHIDRLTLSGSVQGAWIFPCGEECAIVAALAHLPVACPGFGCTDCRRCASHLLAWPASTDNFGLVLNATAPAT
jgi:Uri superfamily endonuclease